MFIIYQTPSLVAYINNY